MYAQFFNLREMPFAITPDPAYLYLSPRHQEALGHLLYGTGQYGGFVQLTGEVGTGKTTVMRTLLEQKLGDVDVAIMHNPRQSEHEFVASICDELGVAYAPEATLKALIDALNAHLLRTHGAGRRTVLIIDEAQNLSRDVLEQVRLLTNLETHKEKLLRIMLIGQPELVELLARPDLRQLSSRITARYHLMPLDERETGEYIRHRLRVAGTQEELFLPAAVREIHRFTRGVPRLINVLCDRALLGAYGQGLRRVTPEIVRKASVESLGAAPRPLERGRRLKMPAPMALVESVAVVLAVVLALTLLYRMFLSPTAATPGDGAPLGEAPASEAPALDAEPAAASGPPAAEPVASAAAAPSVAEPVAEAPPQDGAESIDLTVLLQTTQPLPVVMSRLIRLWDPDIRVPRGRNVCAALGEQGLECYKANGEWGDLQHMNRPAILSLSTGRGDLQHVLLLALSDTEATVDTSRGRARVALQDLDALWTGEFLLLWPRETPEVFIGPGSAGESVVWLRRRLAELVGQPVTGPLSDRFDAELGAQVAAFQARNGLDPDGLAGVRTLIALSRGTGSAPTLEQGT